MSIASSDQWPKKPPRFVQSESMKSRHGSRSPFSGTRNPASACRAVAVESRSGMGASGIAKKPPDGRQRASNHAANARIGIAAELTHERDHCRSCWSQTCRGAREIREPAIFGAQAVEIASNRSGFGTSRPRS